MSHEGVQIRGKDGGAHAVPRESSFDEGILCLTKDSFTSDIREISDSNSLQLSQDGGATISIRGLLAGDGEDLDSFAYDQASVDPTEWMKSRCKSLGIEFDSVGEENVGDILGLDPESKDNLMTMGGQFLNGAITEDSSIILCTDGVSLVNPISASDDSKCSDIIPICSLADELNSRTEQALCTPDSQSSTSLLHTPSSSVFSDLTSSLSVSESSSLGFQLHDGTRVKLESVTDLESLTPSQTSVQSILGTSFAPCPSPTTSQSLLGSVTNVTAASTADSPVTGILPNFLGIDSTLSTPSENDLELLGDGSGGSGVDSLQQSVFLASSGESMDTEMVSAAADSDSHISLSDPGNVTLATICVSTDKEANSTQILVNTSQGQQLYMINTADLNQATNAIMPLTQASDGQQSVQASTVNVAPPAGYLLLPVVEGNVAGGALQGVISGEGTSSQQKQASREIWLCSEPGCGKAFAKLSKLKIHAMQHTGERPFKCSKQGCDWAFTTAYKLKRHEESHEGKKEYDCDYEGCNRKFTTIYNLNSHRRLHERPCTEHCPEDGCDQSFPTKRQLEIHLRVHTGEEKTYKCPYPGCKAWFFSPNSMGSHARMHKDRPQVLRCEFDGCGKEFDRLCRLKQHVRQHTGEKPYICHFEGCTWAFTTASKLKRHQAKHLGLRKFQCHLCSKGFMRAEHLKGHLITHSGVKPFVCPVEGCDVSFTAKSSLYVHLTKHDKDGGKMTFHCPMEGCGKKYSTKLSLRNHIFKHYLSSTEGGSMTGQEIAQLLLGVSPDSDMLKDHDLAGDEASNTNSMSDSEPSSQLDEGGVEISSDQLTSATVTQLMSSQVTIDAGSPSVSQASPGPSLPKITLDQRQSRLRLENRSGSARTDYQSNHLLSDRARRRWHQQRDHTAQNVSSLDSPLLSVHIQGSDSSSEKDVSLMKQDPDSYISPDSSLSGLTFTDPETGITYVQTQLLQDDPPQTVLFSNDAVGLGGDGGGLGEGGTAGIMDMVSASHFTGTTINLQDLV